MSMEYIRDYYGVPAKRGCRIRFNHGGLRLGTITGSSGQYLLVRFDDSPQAHRPERLHPTWEVEYLDDDYASDDDPFTCEACGETLPADKQSDCPHAAVCLACYGSPYCLDCAREDHRWDEADAAYAGAKEGAWW